MASPRIKWSDQAKAALKHIYQYYKKKSVQGAKRVRKDLLEAPKTIRFSKQYQVDDTNSKYRRIIVRSYKIIYKETAKEIRIVDIISTDQDPEILKGK